MTREELTMKERKLLTREKVSNLFTSIGAFRFKISHSSMIHISLLLIILVIAATIRLLPIRWGMQLSEFDPHIHYRLAKQIVDNGFFSWTTWIDPMSWYPQGYNIPSAILPGLGTTVAVFYQIANAINLAPSAILSSDVYHPLTADPLFNFCIIFPVIMATLTVLVIYFVGRELGGKEVGLFSAFFLAVSSPYISRTSLGFFDDETVGIFGILLFVFFFLRSIDPQRSIKSTITNAVIGGLSLGYLFSSWGAARYPLGIVLVFVFVLLLLRRYSFRLFISYGINFAVALFIAINVPKLGIGFLTEPTVLAVIGMFLILCTFEISKRIELPRKKLMFIFGFWAIIAILFIGLSSLGLVGELGNKFISVIIPSERLGESVTQQLVQSVQEHRPTTWGSFYYDLGIGVLFIPIGLFFVVQNPTNRNIFLGIFGLTSIYFAASMARLSLLMAPAVSILWALALVQLIKPFVTILREKQRIPRRKMRFRKSVGKEFSAGFIVLIFLLLTVNFVVPTADSSYSRIIERANSPTTIAASSLPLRAQVSDWLDALNWMWVNLPPNAVVLSWWDYGYWITTIANKTTLADNGTVNTTQIGMIGRTFVSNETEAIEIIKQYDVTHVVIFISFGSDGSDSGYGDEGKWRWMARIAGLNDEVFGNYTLGKDWTDTNEDGQTGSDELITNENGTSTVLYKLMHYARDIVTSGSSPIELEYFEKAYFSQEFENVKWIPISQSSAFTAMVCVYEVILD